MKLITYINKIDTQHSTIGLPRILERPSTSWRRQARFALLRYYITKSPSSASQSPEISRWTPPIFIGMVETIQVSNLKIWPTFSIWSMAKLISVAISYGRRSRWRAASLIDKECILTSRSCSGKFDSRGRRRRSCKKSSWGTCHNLRWPRSCSCHVASS